MRSKFGLFGRLTTPACKRRIRRRLRKVKLTLAHVLDLLRELYRGLCSAPERDLIRSQPYECLATRPVQEHGQILVCDRGLAKPSLALAAAGRVFVEMRHKISQGFGIGYLSIERSSCLLKFGVSGKSSDTLFKRKHLVDGDDEHERSRVNAFPCLSGAFPRREGLASLDVSGELVFRGPRPYRGTSSNAPSEVVKGCRTVFRSALC
jgi:hypothetical protein